MERKGEGEGGGVEGAGAGGQAGMRDSQQTEEMQEGEQEIPQDGRTYRQTDGQKPYRAVQPSSRRRTF